MTQTRVRLLLLTLLAVALLALLTTREEPQRQPSQATSSAPPQHASARRPSPPNRPSPTPPPSNHRVLPGVNLRPGAVEGERLTWKGRAVEVARREILLDVAPGARPAQVSALLSRHGVEVVQRSRHHQVLRVRLRDADPRSLAAVLRELDEDPRVAYAGPNHVVRGASPNGARRNAAATARVDSAGAAQDARLMTHAEQFAGVRLPSQDPAPSALWHVTSSWRGAWGLAPSASGVTVALLDSGVAYEDRDAPEGSYRVAPSLACTPIHSPFDAINQDPHANDDHQHGTHLASLLASDPSCGPLRGYAPGVTLVPVKVLDRNLVGTEMALVEGIYHAIEAGADVINMSLSFNVAYEASPMLLEALGAAASQEIVMVAAAGNTGEARVSYPAQASAVIAVGAWAPDDAGQPGPASYSNTGAAMEVWAAGGDLDQDTNGDGVPDGLVGETFALGRPLEMGYWLQAGTSQAAVGATGLAALLLASGVPPGHVRGHLSRHASFTFNPGAQYGNGVLAPHAAVAAAHAASASPDYYVNLIGGLKMERKFVTSYGRVQVLQADMRPAPQVIVKGRWSGVGVPDEVVTCTTDADGRCTLVRRVERQEVTLIGLQIAQVTPGGAGQVGAYGVPARSYFQMTPSLAQAIQSALGQVEGDVLLTFLVDPEDAALQELLGARVRLTPSHMIRALAPVPGRKPSILLTDQASLDTLAPVTTGTDGTGLGASSRLVWSLSPSMFTSSDLQLETTTLSLTSGTGLGASSDLTGGELLNLDTSYTLINDVDLLTSTTALSYWATWGTGLGASSRLVWELDQITVESFSVSSWPSETWSSSTW